MGTEQGPEFYTGNGYMGKYEKNLPIYEKASSFIFDSDIVPSIIELGCGVGFFAKCLRHLNKNYNYIGVDFSPKVIEIARSINPKTAFICGNLLDKKIQLLYKPESIYIILEVLEHIENDIDVIKSIPANSIVILSVPNRDFSAHVRFFRTMDEVVKRYSNYLTDIVKTEIITNPKKKAKVFMIFARRI